VPADGEEVVGSVACVGGVVRGRRAEVLEVVGVVFEVGVVRGLECLVA